ncbi:MAG: DNA-3-methyladenine glycosylase 2 family protein [Zoogloeaceae bacterium]|nr:DNA-3-methyladenine glycosylase 2 family protein [Zoogloeaceae bacterium]
MTDANETPAYWHEATQALAAQAPALARLIAAHPGAKLVRRNDAFTTLARAIVGQQISVKAAEAIWQRGLQALACPATPDNPFPQLAPAALLACPAGDLRAAGLSLRKVDYLQDLARHFAEGWLNPADWQALPDEALITALTAVRGIGRWTAEMFLIFHEHRPDVFPLGDIGLIRAMRQALPELAEAPPRLLARHAEAWRPWRSVATWYLWRSLDAVPVEY